MAHQVPFPRSLVFAVMVAGALGGAALADELRVPSQYPTIQAGVSAAAPGDTVLLADGVYQGPGNKNISFAGKSITLRSEHGPAACIIDCQASPTDPHRALIFQSGETAGAVVDGLTLSNGATPNGAVADQFNGAGILCTGTASPTIRNCIFTGNRAGCWGGAVCAGGNAAPFIASCTFRGNYSADDGGGFFSLSSAPITLVNCTFTGNSAPSTGGAVTVFSGQTRLINCLIVGNTSGYGSGLYAPNSILTNCIVRANTGDAVQVRGSAVVTYSNIQGGAPGAGNIDADPLFVASAAGDFRLRPWSPCIDAGSSPAVPAAVTTDAAGSPRFRDDTGTANLGLGTPTVDIGPFEFQGTTCASDWDHNGATEPADVAAFVNAWFTSLSTGTLAGDFDRNGIVQPSDIAAFITRWFSGC